MVVGAALEMDVNLLETFDKHCFQGVPELGACAITLSLGEELVFMFGFG